MDNNRNDSSEDESLSADSEIDTGIQSTVASVNAQILDVSSTVDKEHHMATVQFFSNVKGYNKYPLFLLAQPKSGCTAHVILRIFLSILKDIGSAAELQYLNGPAKETRDRLEQLIKDCIPGQGDWLKKRYAKTLRELYITAHHHQCFFYNLGVCIICDPSCLLSAAHKIHFRHMTQKSCEMPGYIRP
jgi:hypothetical protein